MINLWSSCSARFKNLGKNPEGIGGIVARKTAVHNVETTDAVWPSAAGLTEARLRCAFPSRLPTRLKSGLEREAILKVNGSLKKGISEKNDLGIGHLQRIPL
jgi:hypothetical protein